jgi:hypothetical protein
MIGNHQHGFRACWGIQELSHLATHLIQDAGLYKKPLLLVSFDMKKAFNRAGSRIILQALQAFGVLENLFMAMQSYTLQGFAYVEVDGWKGIPSPSSGQGDPLSSILFLIATELLNHLQTTAFMEIMY